MGAVFIDLTKAFDTVSHGTLLRKLNEYSITGIENEWLTNIFLTEVKWLISMEPFPTRHHCYMVCHRGQYGPLLFLLYFNDFPDCLEKCDCFMYADDTVVYVAGKTIKIIENELEKDLE